MSAANSALESVLERERQAFYARVERVDEDELRRFNVWDAIVADLPDAKVMYVDAEDGAVYFDPGNKEFLILAEISIGDSRGTFERTIPAAIRAQRSGKKIELSDIKLMPYKA